MTKLGKVNDPHAAQIFTILDKLQNMPGKLAPRYYRNVLLPLLNHTSLPSIQPSKQLVDDFPDTRITDVESLITDGCQT
jgi:hypothetical protein